MNIFCCTPLPRIDQSYDENAAATLFKISQKHKIYNEKNIIIFCLKIRGFLLEKVNVFCSAFIFLCIGEKLSNMIGQKCRFLHKCSPSSKPRQRKFSCISIEYLLYSGKRALSNIALQPLCEIVKPFLQKMLLIQICSLINFGFMMAIGFIFVSFCLTSVQP